MIRYASLADEVTASVLAVVNQLPLFTREEIDWAGSFFASGHIREPGKRFAVDILRAVTAVNTWRTAHQGPLSRMRESLVPRAQAIDADCMVASRLKRLNTIVDKCSRLPKNVTLSQMQDVGGLRVVLDTPASVYALEKRLRESPPEGFRLEWPNDYIRRPKDTGYRSLHLIYCHDSNAPEEARIRGLRIEVQLRSRLQHAWGTANEMVGTFRREDLKSNRGDPNWLRYFAVAGSIIALSEGLSAGRNVPKDQSALYVELNALETKLSAFERITGYSMAQALHSPEKFGALHGHGYAVMRLDIAERRIDLRGFGAHQFKQADEFYRATEKEHLNNPDMDIVLVFLENLALLQQAYPNYFADAGNFLHAVYPDWQQRIERGAGRFQ